ncbi:MAG: septal ring lytic transglycosylase RlpA family protein [Saprospiraceae bacterium]|nr:septal ring lytic transglycosylase RlpA family protein [Saprospiraceae bacterium]HRD82943.1 septal ring lytic transglycosylase RlpA family protein [Saprospiraceae bacterium]
MRQQIFTALAILGAIIMPAIANAQSYTPITGQQGIAMFYADYFEGQTTAHGEVYRKTELTCSHGWLPKGTLVKVTRQDNGRSVTLRVNDKGDFQNGVIIMISYAAAAELDIINAGKARVTVEQTGYSDTNPVSAFRARSASSYATASYNSEFTAKGGAAPVAAAGYYGPSPSGAFGGYGLQLGAYSLYDNALRRQEGLLNQGVAGVLIRENMTAEGGRMYRVVIGSFASRTDAETYLRDYLKPNYIADGVVVQLK